MKKNRPMVISASLIAITTMAIYQLGIHHGRTGEGLSVVKMAVASETKSSASPVKALADREVY